MYETKEKCIIIGFRKMLLEILTVRSCTVLGTDEMAVNKSDITTSFMEFTV